MFLKTATLSTPGGKIEQWTISRPDRGNSLGFTVAAELLEAMGLLKAKLSQLHDGAPETINKETARITNSPRVLVISAEPCGKDQDIWVAGGDLAELSTLTQKREGRAYAAQLLDLCNSMENIPIPVIAKIDGRAIGGGIELALAADIRLATKRSSLEFRQLVLGLSTGYGSCRRLVDLIGKSRAADVLLRTRSLSAQQAEGYGLIHEIFNTAKTLDDQLTEVCRNLSELSPLAIAAQKKTLQNSVNIMPELTQEIELDTFEQLWMATDHRLAINKFTERK